MDIDALLKSFISVNQQRETSAAKSADMFSTLNTQITQQEASNTARGRELVTQQQQVAADKTNIEAEEAQLRVRSAQLAGFNKGAVEDAYTQALARYNRAETQRQQVRQEFDRLAQIDPLENPVGAIFASIEMQRIGAANNALVAQRDGAARDVATRRQMIADYESGAAVDNVAAKKDLALAGASLQAQAGYLALDKEATENLSRQGARILTEMQARDKVFDIRNDMLGKVMTLEQWRENKAFQREQMVSMAEARADRASKLKEDNEERQQLNRRLAAASATMGLPEPITVTTLPFLAPALKQAITIAAFTGTFGEDVGKAVQTLASNLPVIAKTNPELASTLQNVQSGILSQQETIRQQNRTSPNKIPEKLIPEEAISRFEQESERAVEVAGSGIGMFNARHDTVFNPHKVQPSRVLTAAASGKLPQLANNEYAKLLALTTKAAGAKNAGTKEEAQAWKLLAEKVSKKELTEDQAATAVSQFYKEGNAWQYQNSQYGLLGIPPARRYMAVLPDVTFFGQPVEANLFDPADVKRALTKANVSLAAGSELYKSTQTGTVVPDLFLRGFNQAVTTGAEKISNR